MVVRALGVIGVLLMLGLCIGVAVVYLRRKERQAQEEIRRQEERREQVEQERRSREQEREERREELRKKREERREQQEQERTRREQERARQIEALQQRDAFRDRINYMSGTEFEHFMANVFKNKGYPVKLTPTSGDQGVDLLLDIDERKVAVQLKRYTAPVGNAAIREAFAGMMHYKAQEAWVITTSSFTKSAVELAKSTGVRLIDRNELEDWLSDLREEA